MTRTAFAILAMFNMEFLFLGLMSKLSLVSQIYRHSRNYK